MSEIEKPALPYDPAKEREDIEKYGRKFILFRNALFNNTDPRRTPTKIAREVYDCKNNAVAASIASQNLKKLNVTMVELLDRMGLTDEQDVKDLMSLRKARETKFFAHEGTVIETRSVIDHSTRAHALDLTFKLKGKINNGNKGAGAGDSDKYMFLTLNQINLSDKELPIGDLIKAFTNKLSEGNKGKR